MNQTAQEHNFAAFLLVARLQKASILLMRSITSLRVCKLSKNYRGNPD
jgi:hypothetical protein